VEQTAGVHRPASRYATIYRAGDGRHRRVEAHDEQASAKDLRRRRSKCSGRATAIVFAAVTPSVSAVAAGTPAPSAGCHLANGIKHVIEITFDNVHYNRDNPNVLSDLEQMPALEKFITSQGTLLSNNHTPLIAHTADDTITNYTGLYGARRRSLRCCASAAPTRHPSPTRTGRSGPTFPATTTVYSPVLRCRSSTRW
jgi:hypothetical protein